MSAVDSTVSSGFGPWFPYRQNIFKNSKKGSYGCSNENIRRGGWWKLIQGDKFRMSTEIKQWHRECKLVRSKTGTEKRVCVGGRKTGGASTKDLTDATYRHFSLCKSNCCT